MSNLDYHIYRVEKKGTFSTGWEIFNETGELEFSVVRGGCASPVSFQFFGQGGGEQLRVEYSFWDNKYLMKQDGQPLATIKKKLALFKNELTVDTLGSEEILVKGNWVSKEYRFFKGDDEFAFVSRKAGIFDHDKYAVAIERSVNPLLILGIVMAIQHIIERSRQS